MTAANDTARAALAHAKATRPTDLDLETARLAIARAHALTDLLRFWWQECSPDDGSRLAEGLAAFTAETAFHAALAELEVAAQCLARVEVRP